MPTVARRPNISWVTKLLFLLYCTLVNSAYYCDSSIYGTVVKEDCLIALYKIPFISEPTNPKFQRLQVFAEPQFMDPPFSGIDNRYRPDPIIQLPKIWKHSTIFCAFSVVVAKFLDGLCRFLHPRHDECRHETLAKNGQNSLRFELEVSRKLHYGRTITNTENLPCTGERFICTTRQYVFSLPKVLLVFRPLHSSERHGLALLTAKLDALAFYVYSSDAWWNNMMNTYMTLGNAVVPYAGPEGPHLLSNSSASDQPYLLSNYSPATSIFSGTSVVHIEPLAPEEVVLVDET